MPGHLDQTAWRRPLSPGLSVATAVDRAGALGAVVFDRVTGRPLLLSASHVLVEPAGESRVWQPAPCGKVACDCNVVGRTLRNRCAVVRWCDEWYYVDAAVASIDEDVAWEAPLRSVARATAGMLVRKTGPGTGCTEGIVVDACHVDRVWFGQREVSVPNQICVRALPPQWRFAGDGDSGAIIFDQLGRAIGVLWGADRSGHGVACPIGPVLAELDVTVEQEAA